MAVDDVVPDGGDHARRADPAADVLRERALQHLGPQRVSSGRSRSAGVAPSPYPASFTALSTEECASRRGIHRQRRSARESLRAGRAAGGSLAGAEQGHQRRGGGGVLDDPDELRRQADHLPQPVHHHLLQLGRRRRGRPGHALARRWSRSASPPGSRAGCCCRGSRRTTRDGSNASSRGGSARGSRGRERRTARRRWGAPPGIARRMSPGTDGGGDRELRDAARDSRPSSPPGRGRDAGSLRGAWAQSEPVPFRASRMGIRSTAPGVTFARRARGAVGARNLLRRSGPTRNTLPREVRWLLPSGCPPGWAGWSWRSSASP